jgi:hypothetical protein|tara:strand:+ start:10 stop:327 length:318 start_codon:yes stop_codon:yes gene_type:complete
MIQITDILDNEQIEDLLFDEIQYGWSDKLFEDTDITTKTFIEDVNLQIEVLMDWRECPEALLAILNVLYKYKFSAPIECELSVFLEFGRLNELTENKNKKRKIIN